MDGFNKFTSKILLELQVNPWNLQQSQKSWFLWETNQLQNLSFPNGIWEFGINKKYILKRIHKMLKFEMRWRQKCFTCAYVEFARSFPNNWQVRFINGFTFYWTYWQLFSPEILFLIDCLAWKRIFDSICLFRYKMEVYVNIFSAWNGFSMFLCSLETLSDFSHAFLCLQAIHFPFF